LLGVSPDAPSPPFIPILRQVQPKPSLLALRQSTIARSEDNPRDFTPRQALQPKVDVQTRHRHHAAQTKNNKRDFTQELVLQPDCLDKGALRCQIHYFPELNQQDLSRGDLATHEDPIGYGWVGTSRGWPTLVPICHNPMWIGQTEEEYTKNRG
jgi:hypothetical protein